MNDTAQSVDQQFRAMLMEKSGAERMQMGSDMFEAARCMMLASFPKDLPLHEVRRLILARTYPHLTVATMSLSPPER